MGGLAAELLDLMPHEVSVQPWAGTFTEEGNPNHGAAVAGLKCLVEERVRVVRDSLGAERVSNTTVYVAGGPFTAHDRVTLPSSYQGPTFNPPIISVANYSDENGHCYSEIYL